MKGNAVKQKAWDTTVPTINPRPLEHISTERLVKELFVRGTSSETIFGYYYALEAQLDARHDEIFGNDEEGQHGAQAGRAPLTVGDALLMAPTVTGQRTPEGKQPF